MCKECVSDTPDDTPKEVIFEDELLERIYDSVTETLNEGCFRVIPTKDNG